MDVLSLVLKVQILVIASWAFDNCLLLICIGYCSLVIVYSLFGIGSWLLVTGYWLLVNCYWLLVIGYWLLVIGYCLLVIGY